MDKLFDIQFYLLIVLVFGLYLSLKVLLEVSNGNLKFFFLNRDILFCIIVFACGFPVYTIAAYLFSNFSLRKSCVVNICSIAFFISPPFSSIYI